MKIQFDGANASELLAEIRDFLDAVSGGPQKTRTEVRQTVEKDSSVKRGPGRPPKEESKKGIAAKAVKPKQVEDLAVEEDPFAVKEENLVGPPGFEPAPVDQDPQLTNLSKAITKDDLVQVLQKLCEKEDASAGDKVAGINRVREILTKFGVKRVGELDEKRYHEMYAVAEAALN